MLGPNMRYKGYVARGAITLFPPSSMSRASFEYCPTSGAVDCGLLDLDHRVNELIEAVAAD
jgi:hypothetical protein